MLIKLIEPIALAGRTLTHVELRPPGRRVVERMSASRLPGGWTDDEVIRLAARVSVHSEATMRRLAPPDLDSIKAGLEQLYVQGARRLAMRPALAGEAHDA